MRNVRYRSGDETAWGSVEGGEVRRLRRGPWEGVEPAGRVAGIGSLLPVVDED
jgi:hypothetical protein